MYYINRIDAPLSISHGVVKNDIQNKINHLLGIGKRAGTRGTAIMSLPYLEIQFRIFKTILKLVHSDKE